MTAVAQWLEEAPVIVIGGLTSLLMVGAALVGSLARGRLAKAKTGDGEGNDSRDGYVVSAVLGLLALLLGFTFSLAIDRFEARRTLVLQEANAIGTSYLYAQLLDEPHRSRMSGIVRSYAANRVELGRATSDEARTLLVTNDRLLVELWSATAAAFDDLEATPFSNAVPQVVSEVIDLDAKRKAARHARVPSVVFVVLLVYVVVTAGMLGYVRAVSRRVAAVGFLFVLKVMSLMLILDIDRPDGGGVRESQEPLVTMLDALQSQPPETFDRWRHAP